MGLGEKVDDLNYIAQNTPVVEDEHGFKHFGGLQEVLLFCATKDQRNAIKFDEKGKPIKPKMKKPKVPSLYED